MLAVAKDLKPYHLTVIGDFADFYALSSHSKNPHRRMELKQEIADVNVGLDELDALKCTQKTFIGGNHEDRLQRYLQDKAPEFFDVTDLSKILRLKKRGWEYVPYKKYNKVGKVYQTHDVGVAGRYSTFKALDTFEHSVITGHSHRLQYIVEGNAVGESKLSAQFGWLGDSDAIDYMQTVNVNKNWALGFGVGYIDHATGLAYLTPVPIIRKNNIYSCCVNGKIYKS